MSSSELPRLIQRFTDFLKKEGFHPEAEGVLDAICLIQKIGVPNARNESALVDEIRNEETTHSPATPTQNLRPLEKGASLAKDKKDQKLGVRQPQSPLETKQKPQPDKELMQPDRRLPLRSLPIQVPAAPALRRKLELARNLRPLRQQTPSRTQVYLEEEATVIQWVEQQILSPVMLPAPEKRFDLDVVIEEDSSNLIWEKTIQELLTLVTYLGLFRQVRSWLLRPQGDAFEVRLNWKRSGYFRKASALKDPVQRQLIWVISDCTSPNWDNAALYKQLWEWGKYAPLAILQLFPERLWERTALLDHGQEIWFWQRGNGVPLRQLAKHAQLKYADIWEDDEQSHSKDKVKLPTITIEPEPFRRWSRMTIGHPDYRVAGFEFDLLGLLRAGSSEQDQKTHAQHETAEQRLHRFQISASRTAQQLAGLMASVPVSMEIAHLIQATLLRESEQIHVAEVFTGGLLERSANWTQNSPQYQFIEEVRMLILDGVPISKTQAVLDTVSQYVAKRLGKNTVTTFQALVEELPKLFKDQHEKASLLYFAEITLGTLRRLGGKYLTMANEMEKSLYSPAIWPPVLEKFSVEMATMLVEKIFQFATARIEQNPDNEKWVITQTTDMAWRYIETLIPSNIQGGLDRIQRRLDTMHRHRVYAEAEKESLVEEEDRLLFQIIQLPMIAIEPGTLLMGSPKLERGRAKEQELQHHVKIANYWIGQGLITQKQWRVVAGYPPVNSKILFSDNPSRFKGDNNPVEQVSWYQAKEFCDRLSFATGKAYDLPTEAEWEYACRAGTITAFSFGDMITPELANYNGNYTYNNGTKGQSQNKTTPIETYPANLWGIYDMHGNLREWCLDHWHDSYADKPEELKQQGNAAWLSRNEFSKRVLRGGAWDSYPENCRSAYRNSQTSSRGRFNIGFRVVCRGSRSL